MPFIENHITVCWFLNLQFASRLLASTWRSACLLYILITSRCLHLNLFSNQKENRRVHPWRVESKKTHLNISTGRKVQSNFVPWTCHVKGHHFVSSPTLKRFACDRTMMFTCNPSCHRITPTRLCNWQRQDQRYIGGCRHLYLAGNGVRQHEKVARNGKFCAHVYMYKTLSCKKKCCIGIQFKCRIS